MFPRWLLILMLLVVAWYLYVYLHHVPFWHYTVRQVEPPTTANLGDLGAPYRGV